jgi:hypothetical protein
MNKEEYIKLIDDYSAKGNYAFTNESDFNDCPFKVLQKCQEMMKKYEEKLIEHNKKCAVTDLLLHDFKHLSSRIYLHVSLLERQFDKLQEYIKI